MSSRGRHKIPESPMLRVQLCREGLNTVDLLAHALPGERPAAIQLRLEKKCFQKFRSPAHLLRYLHCPSTMLGTNRAFRNPLFPRPARSSIHLHHKLFRPSTTQTTTLPHCRIQVGTISSTSLPWPAMPAFTGKCPPIYIPLTPHPLNQHPHPELVTKPIAVS